ncbi:uncharacterized protein EI90DRAFT_3058598 [Cantharellus anzutake]|uniref:uncharacterized protein n=1 Tax=Cantharellus anzutake TaxID=1750568 RepID=UPI0019064EEF|nr:uncharacterized protein EI90DRAFT_3058598 [Cantharellus anzutake]KAF8331116.1 hypothetical protein EI90DRAFT_3058598 [Cantharellus anzutake]
MANLFSGRPPSNYPHHPVQHPGSASVSLSARTPAREKNLISQRTRSRPSQLYCAEYLSIALLTEGTTCAGRLRDFFSSLRHFTIFTAILRSYADEYDPNSRIPGTYLPHSVRNSPVPCSQQPTLISQSHPMTLRTPVPAKSHTHNLSTGIAA